MIEELHSNEIKINDGESKRQQEAKYISDCETLDKINKPCTKQDLQILNVLPENYLKWKEQCDRREFIQLTNSYINKWVNEWENNRGIVLSELKKFTKIQKVYTEIELKEWIKDKLKKNKKELTTKEKSNETESKKINIKEKYLDFVKDKKWNDASEVLVSYIKINYNLFTTKDDNKTEIWIYKNGIYVPQGKSEIKEILRKKLGKWYSAFVYNNVIAKIEPDTYIESKDFFSINYKNEIPLLNGVLNIFTKELSNFTPKKIFFNKLPIKFDPLAMCPKIDEFLSQTLSNQEDKKVFYEIGGFALLKEYTFEKAFMFVGNGRNGKGKCLELLKRVIGPENCYSLPLSALDPLNPDVHQLFGKMLNLAGDIGSKDLKETSMFKGLTGRDLITSKRKFLSAITFENYAKFIFACNELPMVYDTSKGFWDRWVLLEFPYYFADKEEFEKTPKELKNNWKLRDEDIINKISIPEELSGLLNKFLDGLDRLLIQRKFSSTKGSEDVMNTWIRKSNSFMGFCLDFLEEDYEGKITKKELRKEYLKYCKSHKVPGKTDFVIKKTLQELFGVVDDRETLFAGTQEFIWKGIKFKQIR